MKTLLTIGKTLFHFLLFLAVTTGLTYLAYMFGHHYLEDYLRGNDAPLALTYLVWFLKWWPNIPFWYPLQGAGSAPIELHPFGDRLFLTWFQATFGAALNFNPVQTLKMAMFLSVPFSAATLYLLTTRVWGARAGILAAILYIITPTSWSYIAVGGLASQAIALPFFPLLVLFLNIAFEKIMDGKPAKSWLLPMLVACILFPIAFAFHQSVAASALLCFFVVSFFQLIFVNKYRAKLFPGFLSLGFIGIVMALSVLGVYELFNYPLKTISRSVGVFPSLHDVDFIRAKILFMLNFQPEKERIANVLFESGFFPTIYFLLLVVATFAAAIKRSGKAFAFLATIAFFVFYVGSPQTLGFLYDIMPIAIAFAVRFVVPILFLVPMMAGWSLVGLFDGIFELLEGLFKIKSRLFIFTRVLIVGVLAFVGMYAFWQVMIPYHKTLKLTADGVNYMGYGPRGSFLMIPPWEPDCQSNGECIYYQPKWAVSPYDAAPYDKKMMTDFLDTLDLREGRFDLSPRLGQFVEYLNVYTDKPQLSIYSAGETFFREYYGIQQGAFYNDEFGTPYMVAQMAKWFGVNVAVRNPQDPEEKFDPQYWQQAENNLTLLHDQQPYNAGIVYQLNEPTKLYRLTTKPRVLVIGNFKPIHAYEQFFRLGIAGGFDYDQIIPVEGKASLDAYTLDELKKYQVLILHAYNFNNRLKAENLLLEYVKSGGRVFIDSGWQYNTADWEQEELGEVYPVKGVKWGTLGKDWNGWQIAELSQADITKFDSLEWEGLPWGLNVVRKERLRPWARPILSSNDHVLVAAGEIGNGRIIWSGFNLINHAKRNSNLDEIIFFRELMTWLLPEGGEELEALQLKRDYPDRVEFSFTQDLPSGTTLLWKEGFSPDWKFQYVRGNRKIPATQVRMGPSLQGYVLPEVKPGDKLILSYERSLVVKVSFIISILTIISLFIIWILLLANVKIPFIPKKISLGSLGVVNKVKSSWDNMEEE